MACNALDLEGGYFDGLSGIDCFIFVLQKIAAFFRIIATIPLQCVLTAVIQSDNNITDTDGAITLNNNEIAFFDSGIYHGITFGTEDVIVPFAKQRNRKAYIFLYHFFFLLRAAALNGTN